MDKYSAAKFAPPPGPDRNSQNPVQIGLKLQFEILSLVRNFVLNLAGLSFTPYKDLKAISPYRLKICNSVFQGPTPLCPRGIKAHFA